MDKDNFGLEHEHDEHCGHNHDDDMEVITLDLNDGTKLECGILGIFEVESKEYMALLSIEDGEVLLFGYTEADDAFELTPIDDDEEFDSVVDAYYMLFGDDIEDYEDFDFEDFDDEDLDFDEE